MATRTITFLVTGSDITDAPATRGGPAWRAAPQLGTVKRSVAVAGTRAGAETLRVTATPGRDLVVLQIANGPELVLHPESARDLMLAQQGVSRSSRGASDADGVAVAANLRWAGLESVAGARRGLGDVLLGTFHVVEGPAADLAAEEVVRRVDAQVDPGVYAMPRDGLPASLKGRQDLRVNNVPAANGPILALIHGTFSNTVGTFSKLWSAHPDLVGRLFDAYGGRVYALEHATLGESPIGNALALANALPANANVHLLTHSRGGLVAEVFARVCGKPQIGQDDLAFFRGQPYTAHRQQLQALADVIQRKKIRVTRVVRVACPARGTLLASKRLDAYLSVFKWALQQAGIPVLPQIVEFLSLVAQRRADPAMIPGLAAQIPDNPLVQWLHAVDAPIPGELRVVAGDLQGDSLGSWLKTLMADSFYWTDNDLVVQTRSMYGGGPREQGGAFVLDQGGNVSHFRYFENQRTADAVVDGLVVDDPREFGVIGPLSWAGKSSTGVRARAAGAVPDASKPALFVLPGIVGSNLKVGGERIWLGWGIVNGLKKLAYDPRGDGVEPDGPVESAYGKLIEHFAATHEVFAFGYDWRKPIEEEARRLAAAIDAALDARNATGMPVRIVAHSMGGLLARAMLLESPKTWQRLMAVNGARLLMLGTPNAGSWAPMQVLSGDDGFGNMLAIVGAPFQDRAARQMMAQFPGFIQLQADLFTNPQLASQASWQKLADDDLAAVRDHNWWHRDDTQLAEYVWGVPKQAVIDQSRALRKRFDEQSAAGDFAGAVGKMLLVVGHADFTPTGIESTQDGMVYVDADGDGRVTFDRAVLQGVRTWKLDCAHGDLASKPAAFPALQELLETGRTDMLPAVVAAAAPAAPRSASVKLRPSRMPSSAQPPQTPDDVMAGAPATAPREPATASGALHIAIVHGDLTFVHQPLMLGHYRSMQLTGAERVIDKLLGGAMERRLRTRRYPHSARSALVVPNLSADPDSPSRIPRPESAVIVGLGPEGNLKGEDLVESVFQGAMAACEEQERKGNAGTTFELAATLIGSGGMNVSPGQSAQLVARGVQRANEMRANQGQQPIVGRLVLVELYLDRANEALQALKAQADVLPAQFNVKRTIDDGLGGMRRPLDQGYRGATYDFISATAQLDATGNPQIKYAVDTRRARTELTARGTQAKLMEQLLVSASNESDPGDMGKVLFRLLVPVELDSFLSGSSELVMELDKRTAAVPWELLDTGADDDQTPWAIRCKLVRKLQVERDEFRPAVDDALLEAGALVIGEPACSEDYPRLPGAREEAKAVKDALTGPHGFPPERVHALISGDDGSLGPDAPTVVRAFAACDWRIVHISGHGEPPAKLDNGAYDPKGIVLSSDTFLGPREMQGVRMVPELVFINVCFGAAVTPGTFSGGKPKPNGYDRPHFAANVAHELIGIGVRCVIAAGWAVDDNAARVFAQTFYEAILRGDRFMDAVGQARQAARTKHPDTWAAYQCYGDPDWYLRRAKDGPRARATSPAVEFASVSSPRSLDLALETIATRLRYQKPEVAAEAAKITYLEQTFPEWGAFGFVAEAFGRAWAEAGRRDEAIRWYRRALEAADGTASLKAAEQLASSLARQAPDAASEREARRQAREAIEILDRLVAMQPTLERESLLGSAYKRIAQIDKKYRKSPLPSIRQMRDHYARAEAIGLREAAPDIFYPAMNRIAASLIVDGGRKNWKGLAAGEIAAVRDSIARSPVTFPSVMSGIELRIYEAVAKKALADALPGILSDMQDLHDRVPGKRMWASVRDNARFVLEPYASRASNKEKKAARDLLAAVGRYC